jgi:hypothetical protein
LSTVSGKRSWGLDKFLSCNMEGASRPRALP